MPLNTSTVTEDSPVSDGQMARCFGKKNRCDLNCRLKTVCLDKYREQQEDKRRSRFREAEYIDGMDASSGHTVRPFDDNDGTASDEEVRAAVDQLDLPDSCRRKLMQCVSSRESRETADAVRIDLVHRLGEIYVYDPTGFEIMFFQILAGGNQAALARKRGCTKQNINKIVAKGKKRLEAYRQMTARNPECRLTPREMAVFHAVELDGLTYRQAADVIGCSTTTIFNIEQKMRSKGIKMSKKRTGRRKATKKATAGRGRGGNASQ